MIKREKCRHPLSNFNIHYLLFFGILSLPVAAVNNINIHGTLVAEPCLIAPGDEEIQLDFGTIVDKYLYLNTRTLGQKFILRLTECDISLGNSVSISFSGNENAKLPGLLALDAGSSATGIGIGIETPEGKPLELNTSSEKFELTPGNTMINLQAYVQGEPEAIQNKTIAHGAFSVITTFTLEYP